MYLLIVKQFKLYIMKKILLSLGAAILFVAGAQAQTGFGLKAGVNFHVYKYFYFYAVIQYTHQADPWHKRPYDLFTGTGGLGFQIPTRK